MKRIFIVIFLFAVNDIAAGAEVLPEPFPMTSRSTASGGAFVSVTDDVGSIFINPAGFVLLDRGGVEANFFGGSIDDADWIASIAAAYPYRRTVIGAGWYRENGRDGEYGDVVSLAVASRFMRGTVGSFLSGGASLDLLMIDEDEAEIAGRESADKISASIGAMVRPLPVISIAFSMRNIGGSELHGNDGGILWQRLTRWGVAFLWPERIYLMFERDYIGGEVSTHYGFLVKSGTPLELMGGFSRERISAGLRWRRKAYNIALSFKATGDGRILVSSSVGIAFGKGSSKGKYQY